MQNNQISKRYASAIFEIAMQFGTAGQIFKNLEDLTFFCYDQLCLKEFLSQIYINKKERFDVVDLIGKKLSFNKYFINFVHLLIEDERIGYLPKILSEYSILMDRFLNILRVKVVSAKELKPEEKETIKNIIQKHFNKTANIKSEINEKIIAGYIINIDNVLYDASIKTMTDNLYNYLRKEAYIYGG